MSKQLTIRNVSPSLAKRLRDLAREGEESVNTLVLRQLERIAGVSQRREELSRFQIWSKQDVEEFDAILKEMRKVDADLWK